MAILQSCCFWKSVRKGSFATAIYTLVYFGFSCFVLWIYISDEQEYLIGEREHPTGESILERGDVTPTTVIFNVLFLVCSSLLVISSVMVLIALHYDKRILLLPWIFLMLGDVSIELAHLIYLALTERVIFEPVVGFLFTIDFFIMCLNCYCLLCVVSQYQEYRQGRGCRRLQMAISQSEETRLSPHQKSSNQLNQFGTSPFISTTNQATNISTIPEEAEKSSPRTSLDEENDRYCNSSHTKRKDMYTIDRLRIPIMAKCRNTDV